MPSTRRGFLAAAATTGAAVYLGAPYVPHPPKDAPNILMVVIDTLRVDHVYTRRAPDNWPGSVGRLTRESLAASTIPPAERPRIYVCGSTGFAETVAAWLLDLGHATTDILTERFGGL